MLASKIQQLFQAGQDRKILVHTLLSFVYRGSGILANLLMVPLALDMLDSERYGVWLAIGSVITWFNFLDVGLGNGLRNMAAESLAEGNSQRVKFLFATSFWSILFFVLILSLLVVGFFPLISWEDVFNVTSLQRSELTLVMEYAALGFLLSILLKLTISLYMAHHVHSMQALANCLVQVGGYFGVMYLVYIGDHSLVSYAKMLSFSPLFFLGVISISAFATRFIAYIPKWKNFKQELIKPVLGLGLQFIVVQLMWMLITTTDSYLIAYWMTPQEVVAFSVSFKYFSIINIGFVLVMNPYWSSFTQAYTQGDWDWIARAQKRIQKFVIGFGAMGVLLLFLASVVIDFWMSGKVKVSFELNFAMFIFSLFYMILGSKNYFLNGIGKLKMQMIVLMVTVVLHVVLSYWWGVVCEGGVVGILWGTNVAILVNVIVSSIQVYKLNRASATGIWND